MEITDKKAVLCGSDEVGALYAAYTFDQLMEPVFVSMKVIMEDGLESPLAERIKGGL